MSEGAMEAMCACLGGLEVLVTLDCSDKCLQKINPFSATKSIPESILFLYLRNSVKLRFVCDFSEVLFNEFGIKFSPMCLFC